MIVAIDGPAGAGKSTIAQRCAERLGFIWLNSGQFYRVVTHETISHGDAPDDPQKVIAAAHRLDGCFEASIRRLGSKLHSAAIETWVSGHAAIVEVRAVVNRNVRRIISHNSAVVEGRDIATVLFPDAAVKIYLDATTRERTIRRLRQQGGNVLTDDEIEAMRRRIVERDTSDKGRKVGSLQKERDALYIDTTHLTIDQVCEIIVKRCADNYDGK